MKNWREIVYLIGFKVLMGVYGISCFIQVLFLSPFHTPRHSDSADRGDFAENGSSGTQMNLILPRGITDTRKKHKKSRCIWLSYEILRY